MKKSKLELKAQKTLEKLLDSKDEMVRFEAATTILSYLIDIPIRKEDLEYLLSKIYEGIKDENDEEIYLEIVKEYKKWLS
ncbi:MAG: hypothetical protein PHT02_00665 [Tissierellia bacterium]|nr:hypothetical protein [Tissierellia bacterium]